MNDLLIAFCYFFIIIYFLLLTKLRFRTMLLPNSIFTILWGTCGILSIYNNLGLIKPSLRVHIYIIISIFVFNMIYITFGNRKSKHSDIDRVSIKNNEVFEVNYKLIKFLNIIAIILISKHLMQAIIVLINNGFDLTAVRDEVFVGITESNNFIMMFLTRVIPNAVFNVTTLIAAVDLYMKKNNILSFAILGTVIYTITFGGRFLILNFTIYYLATHIVMKRQIKTKINKKYIGIGIGVLLAVTISRGLGDGSLIDKYILYFVGSFSFLELILQNPITFGLNGTLMYGYLTLGFIFEPIVLVIKTFLGLDIDVPSYYFNRNVQGWYNIGDTVYQPYNNNTTMLYNFLMDFGDWGVIIGTLFIVGIICITEKSYSVKNNIRSLFILVYMYTVIINSTIKYTLTSVSVSLIFILLFICVKKRKYNIREEDKIS